MLIIAVVVLSLITAFCAGVEVGRLMEREENAYWMEVLDAECVEGEDSGEV